MKLNTTKVVFTCLCALASAPLWADDGVLILEDDTKNILYGRYEVIDEHPGCTAPDQLAFRVLITANDFDYILFDPTNDFSAAVAGDQVETEQVCYVTEGVGPDRLRVAVPCTADSPWDAVGWIRDSDVSISLDGHVVACLSPTGLQLVDTSWSAKVAHADGEEIYLGTEFEQDETKPKVLLSTGEAGASMRFRFEEDFFMSALWAYDETDEPFAASFDGIDAISAEAKCVPLGLQPAGRDQIYVGFKAWFAIVGDARQTCTGPDCPTTDTLAYYYRASTGQECIPQ